MKKIIIVLVLVNVLNVSFAQDKNNSGEEKKGGFKKENLFVGGNLNLGFSNSLTVLGLSPYFGYSINKYIDVAVSVNFTYSSQRDYIIYGDKVRQTIYGPGSFIRVFPLKFLFTQVQYEHNFVSTRYLPAENSGYLKSTDNIDANSLLIGGGYAGGRGNGSKSFYYFSVMWDVGGAKYSPYVDGLGRAVPVFRAGYNIALFQGKYEQE
jgi:hypothetical protein